MEITANIWDDELGKHIEIGPDKDGQGLLEIRRYHQSGELAGRIAASAECGESLLVALGQVLDANDFEVGEDALAKMAGEHVDEGPGEVITFTNPFDKHCEYRITFMKGEPVKVESREPSGQEWMEFSLDDSDVVTIALPAAYLAGKRDGA